MSELEFRSSRADRHGHWPKGRGRTMRDVERIRAWGLAERELAWWRKVDAAIAAELEEMMTRRSILSAGLAALALATGLARARVDVPEPPAVTRCEADPCPGCRLFTRGG